MARGVAWRVRRRVVVGAVVALAGCGWSRDRFEADGVESLCSAASACAGTYDPAACVDVLRAQPLEGCDYDPAMGADCVEELDYADCGVVPPFGDPQLEVPGSCHAAFDCGSDDWLAPVLVR